MPLARIAKPAGIGFDTTCAPDTWESHTVRCVTRRGHSGAVISVDGELDAANAGQFADYVQRRTSSCEWLVLDLHDLEFIGTAGFSILRTINSRCTGAEMRWTIVPGAAVSRLLQVCDPDGRLPTTASITAARAALQARTALQARGSGDPVDRTASIRGATERGHMTDTGLGPGNECTGSHVDRPDGFARRWPDPTITSSCAYSERHDMAMEQAQMAIVDVALDTLGLRPGMTLLDIGCGWGAAMRRAVEKYDVNVIGLTLSENQLAHNQRKFLEVDSPRLMQVRLQSWEEFDEAVDRIVSVGASAHPPDGAGAYGRYDDFFTACYELLPDDGVLLLHSIVVSSVAETEQLGLRKTTDLMAFMSFLYREIHPGIRLPSISIADEHAARSGFEITRHQRVGANYVRTLDSWAKALETRRTEAIALNGEDAYETFTNYLAGSRKLFRDGHTDICQFTLVKATA